MPPSRLFPAVSGLAPSFGAAQALKRLYRSVFSTLWQTLDLSLPILRAMYPMKLPFCHTARLCSSSPVGLRCL